MLKFLSFYWAKVKIKIISNKKPGIKDSTLLILNIEYLLKFSLFSIKYIVDLFFLQILIFQNDKINFYLKLNFYSHCLI